MSESRSLVLDITPLTVTVVYAEAHLSSSSVLLLFFTKNFRTFKFVNEIPKLDSGMKLISRYAAGTEYISNAHYKPTGTFSFKYVRG